MLIVVQLAYSNYLKIDFYKLGQEYILLVGQSEGMINSTVIVHVRKYINLDVNLQYFC